MTSTLLRLRIVELIRLLTYIFKPKLARTFRYNGNLNYNTLQYSGAAVRGRLLHRWEDRDEDTVIECQLSETKNPKRMQLLTAAHVIVWDEFSSNHSKELFQASFKCVNGFENQVVLCFGDFRQIAPASSALWK